MLNIEELETWDDARLQKTAEQFGMTNAASADRQSVVFHILDNQAIYTAKEVVEATRKRKGKQANAEEAAPGEPQQKKRGRKPKAKLVDNVTEVIAERPQEEKQETNVVAT
ncbi:MAG: hypothetical protein K2K32_00885, partial [Muribaculaceae bacterium]|nr:hypothetical protein [Muribaculaceae bacterium]